MQNNGKCFWQALTSASLVVVCNMRLPQVLATATAAAVVARCRRQGLRLQTSHKVAMVARGGSLAIALLVTIAGHLYAYGHGKIRASHSIHSPYLAVRKRIIIVIVD